MSENNFNESFNNDEIDIAKNKEQLEYGIKLIIDAYENKGIIYENDIKILLEESEQKDNKIRELFSAIQELTKERDFYKNNFEKYAEDNRKNSDNFKRMNKRKKEIQTKINLSDSSYENHEAENLKTKIIDVSDIRNNKNDVKHSRNIQHQKIEDIIGRLNNEIDGKISSDKNKIEFTSKQLYEYTTPKLTTKPEKSKYSIDEDKQEKIKQYNLSTKFFNECRSTVKPEEYTKLVEILKLYNSNQIGKDMMFLKFKEAFKNYDKLITDFKNIFIR